MAQPTDVAGAAALAICESLLLALAERGILPESEIAGLLEDAAAAHLHAPPGDGQAAMHAAAVTLIDAILVGRTSIRRR